MVSGIEHRLAAGQDGLGLPEVHHGWGEQANAGVAMLVVVPLEELLAEGPTVLDAAEAVREFRAVLQGAELAMSNELLRERIQQLENANPSLQWRSKR